jgi:hypothetical protein
MHTTAIRNHTDVVSISMWTRNEVSAWLKVCTIRSIQVNVPLRYTNSGNFRFELSPKLCGLVLWTFCRDIFSINTKGKGTLVQAKNAYAGVDF